MAVTRADLSAETSVVSTVAWRAALTAVQMVAY